jgi:hypothetical protein
MTTGPRQWIADMRRKQEVLKLRRKALEIARGIVAEEHPEYDSIQLELAACDLCDDTVKEISETED